MGISIGLCYVRHLNVSTKVKSTRKLKGERISRVVIAMLHVIE